MEWFDNELPLCNLHLLQNKDFEAMVEIIEVQQEDKLFGMDYHDPTYYATEVLNARKTLERFQRSTPNFLMEHWVSIPTDFHIDLVPGAIAKHARPYPVPMIHLEYASH
jgi:hypothetical protein